VKLTIDPRLLKPITPQHYVGWNLWRKKNVNIHRGLIELTAQHMNSIHDLAGEVREAVRVEYRPGWFRGFGFGTIIHFKDIPADFSQICQHVDKRNRLRGVWQWTIACFDEDKTAVAIHSWLHGYLRPVYDAVLKQLEENGYQCFATDTEVDALIKKINSIADRLRITRDLLDCW
jgi:hypothetical protein